MSTEDTLIRMVNQIAVNLTHEAVPAQAVKDHIRDYWDPRMKAALLLVDSDALAPVSAAAIGLLRDEMR